MFRPPHTHTHKKRSVAFSDDTGISSKELGQRQKSGSRSDYKPGISLIVTSVSPNDSKLPLERPGQALKVPGGSGSPDFQTIGTGRW